MRHAPALPIPAPETYTAHSTAVPAVQSNEVYPTPCTAVPSINSGSASDKRCSLAVSQPQVERIYRRVARAADHQPLCSALAEGPKERGRARNVYARKDGRGSGDTYELILDAMAQDPPRLRFTVDELRARMKELCAGDYPKSGQVISSCAQIQDIITERFSLAPALEWDADNEALDIADPYLLFFLRWGRQPRST